MNHSINDGPRAAADKDYFEAIAEADRVRDAAYVEAGMVRDQAIMAVYNGTPR